MSARDAIKRSLARGVAAVHAMGNPEDSRRQYRPLLMFLGGVLCTIYNSELWSTMSRAEVAETVAVGLAIEGLAWASRGRPRDLRVDLALVVLIYYTCRLRMLDIKERWEASQLSDTFIGADVVGTFVFLHHLLIACGVHQLVLAVWILAVCSTCWLGEQRVGNLVLAGQAHFIHCTMHAEAQRFQERRRAEERRLEEAKAEERRKRTEQVLTLVLQQVKAPLFLLVSDLKNLEDPAEEPQQTVEMVRMRVGQIWKLFVDLDLWASQAAEHGMDEAGSVAGADEVPGGEALRGAKDGGAEDDTSSTMEIALGATCEDAAAEVAGGAQLFPSGRSSGASSARWLMRKLPLRAVGGVRAAFDPVHPRCELKELVVTFLAGEEAEESVGFLDWVQEEYAEHVKTWLQEVTNDAYFADPGGSGVSGAGQRPLHDVPLRLPLAGRGGCLEATSMTLTSLTGTTDHAYPGAGASRASSDSDGSGSGAEESASEASDLLFRSGMTCHVELRGLSLLQRGECRAREPAASHHSDPLEAIGEEGQT